MNTKTPVSPDPIRERIEKFYEDGILERIRGLAGKQQRQMGLVVSDVLKECAEFFSLARASVHAEANMDLLVETAILCEGLFTHDHYTREMCDFLGEVLREAPQNHQERLLARRAFNSLIAGVNSPNLRISETCTTTLGFVLEQLPADHRHLLRTTLASRQSEDRNLQGLITSICSYLDKLACLDEAFTAQRIQVPAGSVFSIHSAKGGVGKSTVAIALAIELAHDPHNRVCLVDSDDEGPCLEFYLPVQPDAKRQAYRFSDWFTSPNAASHFPDSMIVPLIPKQKLPWTTRISLIPSSVIADDIERLSSQQRRGRGGKGSHQPNRQKLAALTAHILGPCGFTHVIFDTAPGLAHLAYDVLLSTIEMNGKLILVARPRPPDIISLFSEQGYITQNRLASRLTVAVNFVKLSSLVFCKNPTQVATALARTPIVATYMERFPESVTAEKMQHFLEQKWTAIHENMCTMPYESKLMHAGDLWFGQKTGPSVADVIANSKSCTHLAKELLRSNKPRTEESAV